MHVNTLVWLKSDWIRFVIVEFNHLDYSIDSHITRACLRSISARKSAIVHLVYVIIMYTTYEMYKDVASSRSSYTIFLECRGSLLLLVM